MEKEQEEQLLRDGIERLKKRFGSLEIQNCTDTQTNEDYSSTGSLGHMRNIVPVPNIDLDRL